MRPVDRDRLAYVENKALLHYHPLKLSTKRRPEWGQNGPEQASQGSAICWPGQHLGAASVGPSASRAALTGCIGLGFDRAPRRRPARACWPRPPPRSYAEHKWHLSTTSRLGVSPEASLSATPRPRLPQAPARLGQSAGCEARWPAISNRAWFRHGFAPEARPTVRLRLGPNPGLGLGLGLGLGSGWGARGRARARVRVGIRVNGQGQPCACDSLRKSSIERPRGATKSGLPVTES